MIPLPGGEEFRVGYGRLGTNVCQTATYPIRLFEKKYKEKTGKGYVDETDIVKEVIENDDRKDDSYAPIPEASVRTIVDRLQSMAKKTISENYMIGVNAVTQRMVDEAQVCINRLINADTAAKANEILLELFSVLPRKMNNVRYSRRDCGVITLCTRGPGSPGPQCICSKRHGLRTGFLKRRKSMKNILVKTVIAAVCLRTAAKWAKKHIRAGIIVGGPDITSEEIGELIRERMNRDVERNDVHTDNSKEGTVKKGVCFPDGTTRIPDWAFPGTNVSNVCLPDTVKAIGIGAFSNCSNLKQIDLPTGLETIGKNAFFLSGLTEITVPDSVTQIGEGAFSSYKDLKKIVLPAKLAESIKSVFDDCCSLEDVVFRDTEAPEREN